MDTDAKRIVIALNRHRLFLAAEIDAGYVKEEDIAETRAAIESLQRIADEIKSGKLRVVSETPSDTPSDTWRPFLSVNAAGQKTVGFATLPPSETTRQFYAVVRRVEGREYIDVSTMSNSPDASLTIARCRGEKDVVRAVKCEIREIGE